MRAAVVAIGEIERRWRRWIESWSTDGSTWFEDGHEWWGSFLWTAERPGLPWITAIAASSTE